VHVFVWIDFQVENSADLFISGVRDFDCGILEKLSNELGLFMYICKFCPFVYVIFLFCYLFGFTEVV